MTPDPTYDAVRVSARLDPDVGRWRWLVKWFLAIPHLVLLALLWMVFVVLTIVAGLSIAFTGRYPQRIFEFNVGVLRWTWRVQLYAFTLATDRYPAFSLQPQPDDVGRLDIAYPGGLSRRLVWVKWWLLALPHLVIVGVFAGGAHLTGGLIGVLALVAGVHLALGRPYPPGIFDFVMGMHRWSWRVTAYVALMTDDYPPFRFDTGPDEPAPSGGVTDQLGRAA